MTAREDWEVALKDDVILLVSVGEDYVGLRKGEDLAAGGEAVQKAVLDVNSDCPVELLADSAFVDYLSITQLKTTARTLPGIIHAVGQPDLHPGTKFPIGSVFVSKGWLHPPLIGGDIGCGMAWYKTRLSRAQVEGDKGRRIAEKLRGLEGAWRTLKARKTWLQTGGEANSSAGEEWDAALGTVGAGNHFAEIQVVEESTVKDSPRNAAKSQSKLYEGEVVLLIHSGSRGYGSHILKHFTKDGGRNSIPEDDPLAKEYLEAHDRACAWASGNRDLIALRFLTCLEPGNDSWDLGINSSNPTPESAIRAAREAVQSRKVVSIHHNNIEHTTWPPSVASSNNDLSSGIAGLEFSNSNKVYIHRKGAAPTHDPLTNIPLSILPLPGSRATPTLILHPTFNSANAYGDTNALSLAHGAGRALSRAKAATYVAEKYGGKADDLLRGDFIKADRKGNKQLSDGTGRDVNGGCWVVCEEKALVWEEAPEAYKDVWDVGGDLIKKGCAERWGWCRGRVSYKVRKE